MESRFLLNNQHESRIILRIKVFWRKKNNRNEIIVHLLFKSLNSILEMKFFCFIRSKSIPIQSGARENRHRRTQMKKMSESS